jgi:hypothetical protein
MVCLLKPQSLAPPLPAASVSQFSRWYHRTRSSARAAIPPASSTVIR